MNDDLYYEHYTLLCKNIMNPMRLRIIEAIGRQKLNVSDIQSRMKTAISMSNLSNHLTALFNIGVVSREKKGNFIFYFLVEPDLLDVLDKMRKVTDSICSHRNPSTNMINDTPVETKKNSVFPHE
jgi:DNA-binding transcriptional ArsR family regulator